ncbi:MAG TPA: carboxypeptidase regulatory-like domain-containing protein, partial [Polyangia bacterium]|nr:carboxypeptidase regulatory-like domain-containing protein [Polyangia bacterium]
RAKVTIIGNLAAGAASSISSHVIASVPATIPGRPDLEFEGDWPAPTTVDMPAPFMLSVPDSVLGMTAQLAVLPRAPDDRKQAPFSVTTQLAPDIVLSFPTETMTVHGRLLSPILTPQSGFLARAFQNGQLISNAAETPMFSLTIPVSDVSTATDQPITVELAPIDDKSALPRFTSHAIMLGAYTELGDLRLPAWGDPNVFRFDVRGESVTGPPMSGAVVTVRTAIDGSTDGSAVYSRSGVTGADGFADLSLVPGTLDALRSYDITVVPPPDSWFGVTCIRAFPLAAGGTAQAPALARKVALPARAVVSGTLADADGAPAANMSIVATRTDASNGASDPCASAVAAPASATSDKNGQYTLRLDPGTYRIDYDPTPDAAIPRLTEPAVTVSGDATHDVSLPAATLVEGTLVGADGNPLPSVVVHLFRVACGADANPCSGPDRVPPSLRAVARSDARGAFRMVVPQGIDM